MFQFLVGNYNHLLIMSFLIFLLQGISSPVTTPLLLVLSRRPGLNQLENRFGAKFTMPTFHSYLLQELCNHKLWLLLILHLFNYLSANFSSRWCRKWWVQCTGSECSLVVALEHSRVLANLCSTVFTSDHLCIKSKQCTLNTWVVWNENCATRNREYSRVLECHH